MRRKRIVSIAIRAGRDSLRSFETKTGIVYGRLEKGERWRSIPLRRSEVIANWFGDIDSRIYKDRMPISSISRAFYEDQATGLDQYDPITGSRMFMDSGLVGALRNTGVAQHPREIPELRANRAGRSMNGTERLEVSYIAFCAGVPGGQKVNERVLR